MANAWAVRYHGALLADMLAEIPVDQALPDECTQALAPPTAQELLLCTAVRGEFEIVTQSTGPMLESVSDEDWRFGLMSFLTYDAEATDAAYAENLAPMCSEKELERIAADAPEADPAGSPGMPRLACIGNYMGCTMTSFIEQPYGSYQLRMQNFGARLNLLATLAWLRENADGSEPIMSLLEKRPEALKSPTRDVEVGEQGDSIQIRIFDDSRSETWSVPLPGDLRV